MQLKIQAFLYLYHNMLIFRRILKFRYVMLCKETLRPLTLVMMYFLFFVMSGLTPIKPNLVNVCGAFGMDQDGKKIVVSVICYFTLLNIIVYYSCRYKIYSYTIIIISH